MLRWRGCGPDNSPARALWTVKHYLAACSAPDRCPYVAPRLHTLAPSTACTTDMLPEQRRGRRFTLPLGRDPSSEGAVIVGDGRHQ